MLLKWTRIFCCAAIIAAIAAGISYEIIISGKTANKTNAVLVMAREESNEQ